MEEESLVKLGLLQHGSQGKRNTADLWMEPNRCRLDFVVFGGGRAMPGTRTGVPSIWGRDDAP